MAVSGESELSCMSLPLMICPTSKLCNVLQSEVYFLMIDLTPSGVIFKADLKLVYQ